MAECSVKHDNPYCATSEPKIRVDVAHEIERVGRLRNCKEPRRHHPTGHYAQIQDSLDRIKAVDMRCATGSYRLAREFLSSERKG